MKAIWICWSVSQKFPYRLSLLRSDGVLSHRSACKYRTRHRQIDSEFVSIHIHIRCIYIDARPTRTHVHLSNDIAFKLTTWCSIVVESSQGKAAISLHTPKKQYDETYMKKRDDENNLVAPYEFEIFSSCALQIDGNHLRTRKCVWENVCMWYEWKCRIEWVWNDTAKGRGRMSSVLVMILCKLNMSLLMP